MNRILYIFIALSFLLSVVSCDQKDELSSSVQQNERLISFTTENVWDGMTKTVIDEVEDMKAAGGFRVWSTWNPDSAGEGVYYYDDVVFGTSGTLVSSEGPGSPWVCQEEKEWVTGYYNFAAVFPYELAEDGTHTSFFNKSLNEDHTILEYSNMITLDLGDDGLTLATTKEDKANQVDLMYAFSNEDNSHDQASSVNLSFNHAFTLLDIRLVTADKTSFASNLISVTKVKLYGIHDTIYGQLKLAQEYKDETERLSSNIKELLAEASVSTSWNPYYSADYSPMSGFNYSQNTLSIVDDLLVFPESLSKTTSLKILVELHNMRTGVKKEIFAQVVEGDWISGSHKVYELPLDPLIFESE